MSIFERMSGINQRIQQIQGRFGSSNINFTPASMGVGPAQQASVTGPTQTSGITFEQLLSTYTGDKSGYVHGPSQIPYKGKESDFAGTIKEASAKFNVDEDLIRAVIRQESGFNPKAESGCGAMGLMQLMPETAAGLGVKNAWDPHENIMGGVKYLKSLLDRFDGNITKALAGYNAGPGAVEKHGGVPPFAETQNYVRSILGMYEDYKKKS
jgi:hypothetical protein